jgi:hypothetical protein
MLILGSSLYNPRPPLLGLVNEKYLLRANIDVNQTPWYLD